jgi:hypothetical protein
MLRDAGAVPKTEEKPRTRRAVRARQQRFLPQRQCRSACRYQGLGAHAVPHRQAAGNRRLACNLARSRARPRGRSVAASRWHPRLRPRRVAHRNRCRAPAWYARDAPRAGLRLCTELGVEPASLGWGGGRSRDASPEQTGPTGRPGRSCASLAASSPTSSPLPRKSSLLAIVAGTGSISSATRSCVRAVPHD